MFGRRPKFVDDAGFLHPCLASDQMATGGVDPESAARDEHSSASMARLGLLAEVSRAFAEATPGYRALVQTIARAMADHVGDGCIVMLLDATREGLNKVADAHRDRAVEVDCRSLVAEIGAWRVDGNSLPAVVARTGVPALVADVKPELVVERVEAAIKPVAARLTIHSLVVVPIRARDTILGSMALVRSRPGESYNSDDLLLLQELADRAGLAIENVRLYEQAQERAAELEAANDVLRQHAALLENIPDATISLDAQLRIRGWNPGAERLFGWSRAEAVGKDSIELMGIESDDGSRQEVLARLRTEGHWAGERLLRRRRIRGVGSSLLRRAK